MGKCQKCSKYFKCKICNTHLRYCAKRVQFSKYFRADGAHISQKFIIIFIKKLLENTTLCGNSNVWCMINKWKNNFLNCVSVRKKNIYYTESFVSLKTTKLLFTVQQLCIVQKNQRKIVFGHWGNKRGKCNQLCYES